ncbi:hypothetical protein D6D04_09771 [Aureobasidium pullulans]|nr:hypothetical protein D6D04_09771 [Aureobasidium pullulans]
MAPKRAQSQGAISQMYTSLASPDNRSVVTAVAFFAAGVAFLHSSWSEILLPPDETNMLDMTGSRLLDSAIVQIPTQLLHLSTAPCDVTTIRVEALTLIMKHRPPGHSICASSA